nr:hypothetical protein CFP56_72074 [Quercus suber]
MAEQIHHHVVDKSESASASSAPADVASNTINHAFASSGTHPAIADHIDVTPMVVLATESMASQTDAAAADHAENPSAGEAAENTAYVVPSKITLQSRVPRDTTEPQTLRGETSSDEMHNGMVDGSVDNSAQSDTDVSRGDASEHQKEQNHNRTNSVKKPTTFSKVSVTKTFLAKSATPVPVVAKQGEKLAVVGAPAALVARPRLVAKSASGLQSLQKPRVGVESTSGPDASKVWNKNRPVAPPPPKHLTDEELKQQYGIHLATRLQSDETGKDSKWADIDEDEDDWVPETVVWMDGTKSSLAPIEPEPEQKQEAVPPPKPTEPTKPDLSKLKKATVLNTGPPKTILKPGIAAQQAKQQSGAAPSSGLEKPSLKAKSPAPTPVKSPWAPIAPVAAVSPLDVPVQPPKPPPQQAPMLSQDARSYEMAPPSVPAREIAADTFDRSWREGEGGSRELFNSANGRYEPAPEGRRSSVKPEGAYRKPAVLQRPAQTGPLPAELAAPSQARNGVQTEAGSWQGRRGSSISQGSSLPAGRRTSISSKGTEQYVNLERRGSAAPGADANVSSYTSTGNTEHATFSKQSPLNQQMPAIPGPDSATETVAPVSEAEDPVKIQERVMKEKRELAKKRRLEEEARMEQEKQERLKTRLAALAGAGKSRKEREAEASSAPAAVAEKSEPPQKLVAASEQTGAPLSHDISAASKLEKPNVDVVSVAPHTDSAQDSLSAPALTSSTHSVAPSTTTSAQASAERSDSTQRQAPRAHLSPRANARTPFGPQSSQFNKQPNSSYSSPGDRKSQPFGRSPLAGNDSFSSWAALPPSTNVWGSSGIGNGTFETSNSFAPLQSNPTLPPPPGMNRISPQPFNSESLSPSVQHQQLADQQRTFPPPPGIEPRQEKSWNQPRGSNSMSPAPGFGRQANLPAPIGPPSRAHQHQAAASHSADKWQKAAQYMPAQYDNDAAAAGASQKEKDVNRPPPPAETIKETFKQTTAGSRLGGPRRYANPEYTIHDVEGSRPVPSLSPAPPSAQTQPPGPFSTASPLNESWKQGNENTVRIPDGSLNPAHGGLPIQQPPIAPPALTKHTMPPYQGTNFPTAPLAPILELGDQSPPPPEDWSHPASNNTSTRPTVRLPPPPPVVKLPPTMNSISAPHDSAMMPHGLRPHPSWGPPGPSRPLVKQEAWQARFNGLFNRASIQTEVPPSPPKTPPKTQEPVLAVASSSKTQLDDPAHRSSATVSLPLMKQLAEVDSLAAAMSNDVVSKPTIDGMFSEELSFGSLPKVKVPANPIYTAVEGAYKPVYNMLKLQSNSKLNKGIEAQSKPELNVMDIMFKHHAGYFLKVPSTRLNNRLVRHLPSDHTSTGINKERKVSRKSPKGKHANEPVADTAGTNTQATEPKGSSGQKHRTASPSSPAAVAGKTNRENSRKKSNWTPQKGHARNQAPSVVQS